MFAGRVLQTDSELPNEPPAGGKLRSGALSSGA